MRPGGGKSKGSAFERKVCVQLSMWVTKGKSKDCFWRSSMSGGRATIHVAKGGINRQAGDICAVAPEGHKLTDIWFFECKHVRDLKVDRFFVDESGPMWLYWKQCMKQANDHAKRPMLIAKQNNMEPLVVTLFEHRGLFSKGDWVNEGRGYRVFSFEEMLLQPYRSFLT